MKTILLVEDHQPDALLIMRTLGTVGITNPVRTVEDGELAIQYLLGNARYPRATHPLPGLVLLDLKLPGCTGHEVLNWIRSHPTLFNLPVIVLSGSNLSDDIELAGKLGANAYLLKPCGKTGAGDLARRLSEFRTRHPALFQEDDPVPIQPHPAA